MSHAWIIRFNINEIPFVASAQLLPSGNHQCKINVQILLKPSLEQLMALQEHGFD